MGKHVSPAMAAKRKADAFLRSGDHAAALSHFRRAVHLDPLLDGVTLGIGHAYMGLRDYPAAASAFEDAIISNPTDARAMFWLADARRRCADYEGALAALDSALTILPDYYQAICAKAECLYLLRRHSESTSWFERILTHPLADSTGRACALRRLGRAREALSIWQRLADRGHSFTLLRSEVAECQLAMDEACEIDVSHIEDADSLASLALALARRNRLEKALEAASRALALDSQAFQAHLAAGEVLRMTSQYSSALQEYDHAVAMRDDVFVFAGRGECLRMQRRYPDALASFDKALTLAPDHLFAVQGKAATLNALGRFAEALPVWVRALELQPDSQFAEDGKATAERAMKASGE